MDGFDHRHKKESELKITQAVHICSISFYTFMLDQNKPEKLLSEEDNAISDEAYQKIKEAELRIASETVCGMINDFFELIVTESIELETIEV